MKKEIFGKYNETFKGLVSLSTDTEDARSRKALFVLITYFVILSSLIAGAAYLFNQNSTAAGILWGFAVFSFLNLLFLYISKRFFSFSIAQLGVMLLMPFGLYTIVKQNENSSFILIWALLAPMCALILHGYKHAVVWFIDYIILLVALIFFDSQMNSSTGFRFFILQANIIVISILIYLMFQYFVHHSEKVTASLDTRHKLMTEEHERSRQLINNLLPEVIAERLKQENGMIADNFDEVTVLFADIVGFTQLSSQITPKELVDILNILFSAFDMLAEKYGLEKIKTMGDSYMVAAGLPLPTLDHAEMAAEMAREMLDEVHRFSSMIGEKINVRIGLNSGPVVAGVIGIKKSIYDLWGDTVNVASRMESTGVPGKIQVTETTFGLLRSKYHFINRGEIQVKGKGFMNAYILEGPK
jgi:adenylate cyclase